MARPKTWIPQYQEILAKLQAAPPARVYDRPEIQDLFGLSVSGAKLLMGVAGATSSGSGLASTVSRDKLISYVRYCPEVQADMKRRADLAKELEKAAKDLPYKQIPVPAKKPDLKTQVEDLDLSGITFEPGRLVVDFDGTAPDLLTKLFRLSQALVNLNVGLHPIPNNPKDAACFFAVKIQAGFQFEEKAVG